MIQTFAVPILNHLLAQRADCRALLQPHAGKYACIEITPLRIVFCISDTGLLQAAAVNDADMEVAVPQKIAATVSLSLGLVPRLLLQDSAAEREIQLAGEAGLVADLGQVLQTLDWDAEHDLAKLIGDIPAHRLSTMVRDGMGDPRAAAQNLAETTVEYLQQEAQILATPGAVAQYLADVDSVRDNVARLEKRLLRLEQQSMNEGR